MVWLRGDDYRKAIAKARHEPHALLACNVANDSTIRAIVQAANNKNSDIIIQISASAAKFASGNDDMIKGLKILTDTVRNISAQYKIGTAIHIDHAKPEHMDMVHYALDNNLVSSVMIDFSAEPYDTNLNTTREIVDIAHKKDILVEAEIGRIKGKEDDVVSDDVLYTKPEEALDFVSKTNVDLFACAIGTSHGMTVKKDLPLKTDLLNDIHNILMQNNHNAGLVLHGSSGVSDELLKECIQKGIMKSNKDTVFQKHFAIAVNDYWQKNKDAVEEKLDKKRFDPRKWLKLGEDAMQKACEELIDIAGSEGKTVM